MSAPVISAIVPAYNVEAYLADTLESVRAQTFTEWECIIVDDGSVDGTWKIARKFCDEDARFRLIRQKNGGVAAARNAALRNAAGTFVLPLDADDLIAAEYMELALAVFRRQPDVKIVYCRAFLLGGGGTCKPWPLPEYSYKRLIAVNCIFCTCFFRKSDAVMVGGYDESFRNGYEDWEFLLRLLAPEDKVVRIDRELFYYRQHPVYAGNLNSGALKNESSLLERIAEKHPEIYGTYREGTIRKLRIKLESCNSRRSFFRKLVGKMTRR